MHVLFSNHAWYELVSPISIAVAVLAICWYVHSIIKSSHFRTTKTHMFYFFTAVGLFILLKGTPLAVIAGEYLFSTLILELSVMAFLMVPLFILSLPKSYISIIFWHHRRAKVAKALLNQPWILAIAFNALISIYLIPSVFNFVHGSAILQFVYEILFVFLAFLTWSVIIQPSDNLADHSYLKRIALVFFMAMFLMPIGIFLIVVQDPMYATYATASEEMLPALTAVYDQQAAGGILKILQLGSYSFALYYLLKAWGLDEEEDEGKVDDDTRVVQGVVIHLNEHNKRRKGRKR